MILALNIGNSNITFGSYTPDGKLVFSSRLFADTALSSDELLYKMVNMLALYGAEPQEITAIIFSSVVPALTPRIREALRKMCEAPVMEVGPGLKSGVRIRMDNPAQLGGELLCAVVGALRRAEPPLVVVNFDTATTPAGRGRHRRPGGRRYPSRAAVLAGITGKKYRPTAPGGVGSQAPPPAGHKHRRLPAQRASCTGPRPCWTVW